MEPRRWRRALLVALVAGCHAPSPPTLLQPEAVDAPDKPTANGPSGALWVLGENGGVTGPVASVANDEPNIGLLGGERVLVERGALLAVRRDKPSLTHVLGVPKRLGGGYAFSADDGLYWSAEPLGDLQQIARGQVRGPARPWLDGLVVRTTGGPRRVSVPHAAPSTEPLPPTALDAVATDSQHALALEPWGGVLARKGALGFQRVAVPDRGRELSFDDGVAAVLVQRPNASGWWHLDETGELVAGRPSSNDADPLREVDDPAARAALLQAGSRGTVFVDTAGRRLVLSVVEDTAWVFSADSRALVGRPLSLGYAERDQLCAAQRHGDDVLIACQHDRGAHVLRYEPSHRLTTEQTFPVGSGFHGEESGGLAYAGPCGVDGVSSLDWRREEDVTLDDAFADDSIEIACVRSPDRRWRERRIAGAAVRHFYRWVPKADGHLVALLVDPGEVDSEEEGEVAEQQPVVAQTLSHSPGITPVTIGLKALGAHRLPALMEEYRPIDDRFWLDERAVLRGWVIPASAPIAASDLPVARGRVGRRLPIDDVGTEALVGIAISPNGGLRFHRPPGEVIAGAFGGPRALVVAESKGEGPNKWSTTHDGGETWEAVRGPIGEVIDSGSFEHLARCSSAGCTVNESVLRLGWGKEAARDLTPGDLVDVSDDGASELHTHDPQKPWAVLSCPEDGADVAKADDESTPWLVPTGRPSSTWNGTVVSPFGGQGARAPEGPQRGDAVVVWTRRGPPSTAVVATDEVTSAIGQKPFRRLPSPTIHALWQPSPGFGFGLDARTGQVTALTSERAAVVARLALIPSPTTLQFGWGRSGEDVAAVAHDPSLDTGFAVSVDIGAGTVGEVVPLASLHDVDVEGRGACDGSLPPLEWTSEVKLLFRFQDRERGAEAVAWLAGDADRVCLRGLSARTNDVQWRVELSPSLDVRLTRVGAKGDPSLRCKLELE